MRFSSASIPQHDSPTVCLRRPDLAILLVSILGLFLELMLIRWIGSEVRIFAYLQNTVLVVCFLGLGLGCLTSDKPIKLSLLIVPLFLVISALAFPAARAQLARISEMLSVLNDFVIWYQTPPQDLARTLLMIGAGLFLSLAVMILLMIMFVPLGRILGRLMYKHPKPLVAYSINVLGSLLGIWGFVALSALSWPPVAWIVALVVMIVPFLWNHHGLLRWPLVGLLLASPPLAWAAGRVAGAVEVVWSPYQKLAVFAEDEGLCTHVVEVNNVGYQAIFDLSQERTAVPGLREAGYSQYDIPLQLHANSKRVLIVGAGTGNDVAAALRHGAEHVVAVEIDPAIAAIGKRYHPEAPYDSPRTRLIIDDARSFFASCREKFDLIIFGLLDSHTTGAMTNTRLDHYVYTLESFEYAKGLLADGGMMTVSFEAQRPFIAQRIGQTIAAVFGRDPIVFRVPKSQLGWGGLLFAAGDLERMLQHVSAQPELAQVLGNWGAHPFSEDDKLDTAPATDDWPYIYLPGRSIPLLFILLAVLLLFLMRLSMNCLGARFRIRGAYREQWHFFFLGAAFMLLEVQNISKAASILGSTWLVNAVIISGVLCMILAANMVVSCLEVPALLSYGLLWASCLGLYFMDLSSLATLPFAARAVLAGGLTTVPMLFSGLVFAASFTHAQSKDEALGANLLGSLAGGLMASVSLITGLKALLLLVAGLYALAYICSPRPGARPEAARRSPSGNARPIEATPTPR